MSKNIPRFSSSKTPQNEKMQIWMFSKFQDFQLFDPKAPNEKNADLNVSEDFKIFNYGPPPSLIYKPL